MPPESLVLSEPKSSLVVQILVAPHLRDEMLLDGVATYRPGRLKLKQNLGYDARGDTYDLIFEGQEQEDRPCS